MAQFAKLVPFYISCECWHADTDGVYPTGRKSVAIIIIRLSFSILSVYNILVFPAGWLLAVWIFSESDYSGPLFWTSHGLGIHHYIRGATFFSYSGLSIKLPGCKLWAIMIHNLWNDVFEIVKLVNIKMLPSDFIIHQLINLFKALPHGTPSAASPMLKKPY